MYDWRDFGYIRNVMDADESQPKAQVEKPIRVGLTCWLWQWGRRRAIVQLACRTGVTLQLTQRIRGIHREIECQVSGENVDQFVGEFARHC
jgi:hypothetical protein